jgi:hypothetical protein
MSSAMSSYMGPYALLSGEDIHPEPNKEQTFTFEDVKSVEPRSRSATVDRRTAHKESTTEVQ